MKLFKLDIISLSTAAAASRRDSWRRAIAAPSGSPAPAGALLGGAIAHHLRGFSLPVAGLCLVNFHVLFVLSCLGRLALWPLVRKLRE